MLISNNLEDIAYLSADAAEFLKTHDMAVLACGSYKLNEKEFVNVMEYETRNREDAQYEAHRTYIDVQMVISGSEFIETASLDAFDALPDFDEQNDFMLLSGEVKGTLHHLVPGMFVAVMPNDAHMPSLNPGPEGARKNKKAVFKLLAK